MVQMQTQQPRLGKREVEGYGFGRQDMDGLKEDLGIPSLLNKGVGDCLKPGTCGEKLERWG